ncbi:MAG TPA: DUF1592 domain-containing protein [Polyangiaceae bacterium]|nr:DUF1592 domain-containing protein [Polyangiaceae bacterium]
MADSGAHNQGVFRQGVLRTGLGGLVALVVLTSACSTGSGTQEQGPTSSSGDGVTTSTPSTDGTDTTGLVPDQVVDESGATVDCASLVRPPTPLRRLTRFEYNNTVADLLGTALTPADDFPPDEVADGFTNNALVLTISSLHAEKYTFAAEALAAEAVTHLDTLLPCSPADGEPECAQQFAEQFGRKAFRRTLEPEDLEVLLEAYSFGTSFEKGIEIMIRAALQSPHFLFRVEFSGSDVEGTGMVRLSGDETAARLSYLIWSSGPDEVLLDAAENGELSTPEQVESQARRMLDDPKARRAMAEFYRQWLKLNRLDIVSKDASAFPLWSEAMRQAMIAEGDAVIQSVVFGDDPSLTQLLTAPLGLPTGPLADLYGVAQGDQVVPLNAQERAGVMTLPGFLAVQAHPDQTSPVLRGKFVRERLLCDEVPPPPDNVVITPPDPAAGGTARERFSAHASDVSCAKCHKKMDPLGYPFESYDSLGVFRTTDQGQAMDLSGEFVETKAMDGPFDGVHEMVARLAEAPEVGECVASQWYQFAMGRGVEAGDACSLAPLSQEFVASGSNLFELIVQITQSEAFLYRRASGEAAP